MLEGKKFYIRVGSNFSIIDVGDFQHSLKDGWCTAVVIFFSIFSKFWEVFLVDVADRGPVSGDVFVVVVHDVLDPLLLGKLQQLVSISRVGKIFS